MLLYGDGTVLWIKAFKSTLRLLTMCHNSHDSFNFPSSKPLTFPVLSTNLFSGAQLTRVEKLISKQVSL